MMETLAGGQARYCVIASLSCPWSHRVLLVRNLKKLNQILPVYLAGGPRVEGYALHPASPPLLIQGQTIHHLHQLYTLSDPHHTGRVTVPALWDFHENRIVSNDSAKIFRGLDRVDGKDGFTFVPEPLATDIDEMNGALHRNLAKAVYRAGLARIQADYDHAAGKVFETLDWLEKRLSSRRFLFGPIVTETDWRLFATLVRFDTVYATHFRCTLRRLVDYPHLWAYARDLYAWPGVSCTVDFDAILEGYYANDGDHNPYGIIAEMPDIDWDAPSNRERLGKAQLWSRRSAAIDVGHYVSDLGI